MSKLTKLYTLNMHSRLYAIKPQLSCKKKKKCKNSITKYSHYYIYFTDWFSACTAEPCILMVCRWSKRLRMDYGKEKEAEPSTSQGV